MPPIRLLICDRNRLFRQSLTRRLEDEVELHVVADAATGREALYQAERHQPKVVLLDLGIVSPGGLEVVKELGTLPRAPTVVIVSEHADLPHLFAAHYAGVAAYVPKDADIAFLINTVTQVNVQSGRFSLAQLHDLHRCYGRRPKRLPDVSIPTLTTRHKALLAYLVEGRTNQSIATTLEVQEKTVRNDLSRLYRELGVRSRTEAALFAVKIGLFSHSTDG